MQGQHHFPRPPELHPVRLPVPEGPPVGRRRRPLSNGAAKGNKGNRASSPPAPPPPLPLRPRQVAPPIMVLVPRGLGVDEPVDALVRGHRPALFSAQLIGDLLRRPPPLQTRQHPLPQPLVPFQPRPGPAARARPLLGWRRLVPDRRWLSRRTTSCAWTSSCPRHHLRGGPLPVEDDSPNRRSQQLDQRQVRAPVVPNRRPTVPQCRHRLAPYSPNSHSSSAC